MEQSKQDSLRCELKTFLSWKIDGSASAPPQQAIPQTSQPAGTSFVPSLKSVDLYGPKIVKKPLYKKIGSKKRSVNIDPLTNKPVRKPKTFRLVWLENEDYKGWLQPIPDKPSHAYCLYCKKELMAGKSELDKHSVGTKHKENEDLMRDIKSEGTDLTHLAAEERKRKSLEFSIKTAEIKISSFFSEFNIPFQVVDHLVPLIKEVLPDSEIAQNMQLGRTKCTCIVKNVLAKTEFVQTIHDLQKTDFTILLDRGGTRKKFLVIMAQYICPNSGKLKHKLVELSIVLTTCSLYEKVEQCFVKNNVPLCNIICIACDGSNTLISDHFYRRFKTMYPDVIKIECICHTMMFVANHASTKLPKYLEELLVCVTEYPYIVGRKHRANEQLHNFSVKTIKQLHKSGQRWIATLECCNVILQMWDSLVEYFKIQSLQTQSASSMFINEHLQNPLTKCYLYFLKYILGQFETLKIAFENRKIQIQDVFIMSKKIFNSIGQNFLTPKCLQQNYTTVDPANPYNCIPIKQVVVGEDCENILNYQNETDIVEFKSKCLAYYVAACDEMQKKLPLNQSVFKEFKFISPKIALHPERHGTVNIEIVCKLFANRIDCAKTIAEWRNLPLILSKDRVTALSKLSIDEMWFSIGNIENSDSQYIYYNIAKLAQLVMCLPHSTTECDKMFSIVDEIKTIKRNKISIENLNAAVLVRTCFQNNDRKQDKDLWNSISIDSLSSTYKRNY